MCVNCLVGLLFVHVCLLHDCSFPCITACLLCLWGTCVSPYFRITSIGWPFIMDCLCCLGFILNCFPSTKLGVWNRVYHNGYIDVWEHYEDDGCPSNEDLYSLELDFMDTSVASVSL